MATNEPAGQPDAARDPAAGASTTTREPWDSEATGGASRAQPLKARASTGPVRVLSIVVMAAGAILVVAGGVTWFVVRDQLGAEKIVVSDDAPFVGGNDVNGPFSANAQA